MNTLRARAHTLALLLLFAPAALAACGPAEPSAEEAVDEAAAEIAAAGTEAALEVEGAMGDIESAADEAVADIEAAAEEAAEEVSEAAEDAGAALAGDALSGEDVIAQGMALSGTTVTIERCSLMAEPMSDGQMACRLVDEDGGDLADARDLPVDVFFQSADLGADAQAWIAENCAGGFCTARITGDLTISEGTNFHEMTNVSLQTP